MLRTHASSHDTETWYAASYSIGELKSGRARANSNPLAIAVLACCSIRAFVEHLVGHEAAARALAFENALALLDLSSLNYKLSEKYRVYIL